MLFVIPLVLLVLWLPGMVSTCTAGGILHILLVVAIVFGLVGRIRGRTRSGNLNKQGGRPCEGRKFWGSCSSSPA
jgi:uncharacterized membrane protein